MINPCVEKIKCVIAVVCNNSSLLVTDLSPPKELGIRNSVRTKVLGNDLCP